MTPMIIAVDFDGTIVDHQFPDVGEPAQGVFCWLKRFQEQGARLILSTMRSDGRADGTNPLTDAVEFCRKNGIEFWGVNCNPLQSVWTTSPKVYAHLYIGDDAFGCPLKPGTEDRPIADWDVIGPAVLNMIQLHNACG